jgi:CRP/FNR family transcriptional regulator, cyclic AMP receptor protein
VLRSLPDEDAKKLLRASKVNNYARRQALVSEGEKSDTFHIVLDGRVAIRVTRPSGDTAIVNILGPDSHFGEVSLLAQDESRRTASVVAIEPVRTLSIPAAVFHDLRERNPRLERLVSRLLAERVDELSAQLLEAMYDTLERRVVRRLAALTVTFADAASTPVTPVSIPLTQDELAELVGGTRPSVNQVLRKFVDEGILELSRGRIIITDAAALRRMTA